MNQKKCSMTANNSFYSINVGTVVGFYICFAWVVSFRLSPFEPRGGLLPNLGLGWSEAQKSYL
jgi:hypothetical protein